jgi:hypothetical protein
MLSNQVIQNLERFILGCKVLSFILYFDNCIGSIDETHVPTVVLMSKVVLYGSTCIHKIENMLATCDFDMRFTSFWQNGQGQSMV